MNDGALNHIQQLMDRLVGATRSGRVGWQTRDGESFYVKTKSGSIMVASRDEDGHPPYKLTVHDGADRVVESFALRDWPGEEADELDQQLTELYVLARRKALNIDDVVEGIMRDLEIDGHHPH